MIRRTIDLYREAYSGLSRKIWLLSLIMLINRSGTMVLVFFVLYLTKVFGFSNQAAGGIISISAVGGILGALAGGWASDRLGAIRAQVVFLLLSAVQFVVLSFANSPVAIAASLFVLMFFNEAVRPGLHSACLEFCRPENQKRSLGLLRLAVNLGMAIGPVVGGFLAEQGRWKLLFLIDAATCVIAAVALTITFRGEPQLGPSPRGESHRRVHGNSPWSDPRMLKFGAIYLLMLIVFIQIASTFIKYLDEVYGFTESQIGLITAINPAVIVLIEMAIIKAVERHSTLKTIAWGGLLICVGFGILPFGSSLVFCVATVLIWTLGEIFAFPLASAYVADLSSPANRGQYMGFISVLFSVSMIVGPFVGMTLYDLDRNLPWYGALVIGAIVFPVLWSMDRNADVRQDSTKIESRQDEIAADREEEKRTPKDALKSETHGDSTSMPESVIR